VIVVGADLYRLIRLQRAQATASNMGVLAGA